MHLEASDPSFIDVLIPTNAGRNDRLDRIDRLIDWPKVAAILDDVHAALKAAPPTARSRWSKSSSYSSGTPPPTSAWRRRSKTGCRSAASRSSR